MYNVVPRVQAPYGPFSPDSIFTSDLHNNSISYKVHIRFVDRPHESLEYVRCRKGCALSESSSPGQGNVYKEVNIPLLS